jgi:hypothetical protein
MNTTLESDRLRRESDAAAVKPATLLQQVLCVRELVFCHHAEMRPVRTYLA